MLFRHSYRIYSNTLPLFLLVFFLYFGINWGYTLLFPRTFLSSFGGHLTGTTLPVVHPTHYTWGGEQQGQQRRQRQEKRGLEFSRKADDTVITTNPDKNVKPTIAVVGAGAVGGYYGARLWETNKYNIKFHMRGEHYKMSRVNGLNVTSIYGDIFIPPDKLQVYEHTKDIGPVDWVIVALKSTSLPAIPNLIAPLLKQETRVIFIMNGFIEDDVIRQLKETMGETTTATTTDTIQCCTALYGGMALLCSNRIGPGRIDHSYAGLLTGGVAAYNPNITCPQQNQKEFEQLWESTTIDINYESSLLRGRWKKSMWNLPFNGISVAMGGITVDKIVKDPGLRKLADLVMDETVAIANTDLLQMQQQHQQQQQMNSSTMDNTTTTTTTIIELLGEKEKFQMMDLSDKMGPYKTSTMLDFTLQRSMEVQYLFRKPLERAQALGVPAPHLETLVYQIEAFQAMYNLY